VLYFSLISIAYWHVALYVYLFAVLVTHGAVMSSACFNYMSIQVVSRLWYVTYKHP